MLHGNQQIYLLIALTTYYPGNWVECEVNMRILLILLCCLLAFLLGLCVTIGADTGKLILKKLSLRKLEKRIESQVDEE